MFGLSNQTQTYPGRLTVGVFQKGYLAATPPPPRSASGGGGRKRPVVDVVPCVGA